MSTWRAGAEGAWSRARTPDEIAVTTARSAKTPPHSGQAWALTPSIVATWTSAAAQRGQASGLGAAGAAARAEGPGLLGTATMKPQVHSTWEPGRLVLTSIGSAQAGQFIGG